LSEVQRICDRVAIIKEGRIVKTQKISELQQSSFKKVSFTVKEGKPEGVAVEGAQNIEITDNTVSFLFHGDCNLLLSEIAKHPLSNVDISEPTLEEIFMHYYSQ
jgi:ABC-2 type transport system ATP-binding protein